MLHNYTYSAEMVRAEQQEKMLRAERSRLIRAALSGKHGRFAIYKPILRNLGEMLVTWGTSLQNRYADARNAIREIESTSAADTLTIRRAR